MNMKRIIIVVLLLLMVSIAMILADSRYFKNDVQTSDVEEDELCLDYNVQRNMSMTWLAMVMESSLVDNLTPYVEMPDKQDCYPTYFSRVYPELSTLLDTLERHTSEMYFNEQYRTIGKELLWMESYRDQVCRYYDTYKLGCEDVSDYAKVDSVLNYVTRGYGLLDKLSNWNMAVNHSMLYVMSTFKDYLSLMQMLSLCKNSEEKNLLIAEWCAWEKLENSFIRFWDSYVSLIYFGGSIRKVLTTFGYHKIAAAHIEIYEREFGYRTDNSGDSIHGRLAEDILFQQLQDVLDHCQKYVSDSEFVPHEEYNRLVDINEKLKSSVMEWQETRNNWLNAVASGDSIRYEIIKNDTSDVLARFSDILSSFDSLSDKFGQ